MKSIARDTSSVSISAGGDRTPVIPDWSVVTSVVATKALARRFQREARNCAMNEKAQSSLG